MNREERRKQKERGAEVGWWAGGGAGGWAGEWGTRGAVPGSRHTPISLATSPPTYFLQRLAVITSSGNYLGLFTQVFLIL